MSWKIVPAVTEVWHLHPAHSHNPRTGHAFSDPQRGQRKPVGHRSRAKYARHASSVATLAELAGREAELRPDHEPQVNVNGIEELVADKGYHSGAVLQRVKSYQVSSYIPEKQQKGRRNWQGKAEEQQAVYENRRRVRSKYGKSLLRRRGELVERSFAHCYETGGMRRCHLRGRDNILKRQLLHVGAFNLSLILRHLLGAGTPRELSNRSSQLVLSLLLLLSCGNERRRSNRISASATKYVARSRTRLRCLLCRKSAT